MEPIFIWVLMAGVLGGIVRSIFGWSGSNEAFDASKLLKSVVRAAIGGLVFASSFNFDAIGTFFAAITADVLWKEGWELAVGSKVKD